VIGCRLCKPLQASIEKPSAENNLVESGGTG
jgi:hypothetical protein